MDLTPNDDQIALVSATADWCRDHMPLENARSRSRDLWPQIDAMGWASMTGPEMELDHATEALVFAELGRFLAPVALLSSAVAARWEPRQIKVALAVTEGRMLRVLDGSDASAALGVVDRRAMLFDLPAALSAQPSLDPTVTVVRFDEPPSAHALADARAVLHLQLVAAAFAVGCADAARDMAAGYALIREQFERPIGWFQAIKHMCADMAVRAAVARSQLHYAACALDSNADEAAFHVAAAKRLADQAALENSRANIQVHGGIGMTDEALPHLCLKRAHLLQFVIPAERSALLASA